MPGETRIAPYLYIYIYNPREVLHMVIHTLAIYKSYYICKSYIHGSDLALLMLWLLLLLVVLLLLYLAPTRSRHAARRSAFMCRAAGRRI